MEGEIAVELGNVDIDQMKVCTLSMTMTANSVLTPVEGT